MAYDSDSVGRSRPSPALDPSEFERIDRILLGACAAIWLVALGTGVAATVALVDLGRGHAETSGESDTPWLLYTVIAISAVVIVAAVPLLLRARREAMAEAEPARSAPEAAGPQPPVRGVEAPTEKLRITEPASVGSARPGYAEPRTSGGSMTESPAMRAVDVLWLRCGVVIACAIGVAMVGIGVATYLMAVDSDAAAWACYALVGLLTAAMPAVPWYFLRELRALVE